MSCTRLEEKIDDYVDGRLDDADAASLAAHIDGCATCRRTLESEHRLRESLKGYAATSVPHPDTTFFDRAMLKARQSGRRRERNRWVMTGVAGTIAAGLVLWMLGGLFPKSPDVAPPDIPAIVMTLEEPRTINLVFASATELADATMTVVLPPGIEVSGFAGLEEITWMTSLKEGKNVLPLTLVASSPGGGELIATLRHAGDDKTFRVRVSVI